ncbi:hypothetical protein GALMADRAFT_129216 [Galerina marginata CBS 339.88]|uniref:glutathione transferase n=1 Tax=Galerina marginata (strain CBS 339.88) TaxID=685588 RepID=A0A067SP24_GALM3|nr:hypothetical protein GALMADRAFT_129216 [Galerina marginata CBS 339.88]
MVLKLYGNAVSTATRRAATVLVEKQVPFEFIPINTRKPYLEQKKPEYLAKQPFGQIPLLDDDGFLLYESRAIGRYIAEKYKNQGPALIPVDLKAKAIFEQAASSELANFDFYASQVYTEIVKKKRQGLETDNSFVTKLLSELSVKLDAYDAILSKQRFLVGDDVTLVDLFHLPFGVGLALTGSGIIESKPHVNRWFRELAARPSWRVVKDGVKSTA